MAKPFAFSLALGLAVSLPGAAFSLGQTVGARVKITAPLRFGGLPQAHRAAARAELSGPGLLAPGLATPSLGHAPALLTSPDAVVTRALPQVADAAIPAGPIGLAEVLGVAGGNGAQSQAAAQSLEAGVRPEQLRGLFDGDTVRPNLVVVSDLHLNVGRHPVTGLYDRGENWFFDEEWARFLAFLQQDAKQRGKPYKLIINGDWMDFLKVTELPGPGEKVDLSISMRERKYGLGTEEAKTVWKMQRIVSGHELFFRALADFISAGNQVAAIVGNHDIELLYDKVQAALKEEVAKFTEDAAVIMNNLAILPWFYYEPGLIFVEHGHMYDPMNIVHHFPYPFRTMNGKLAVELPPGSFFVRYLYNMLKNIEPYADAIKPASRYLRWALTHNIYHMKFLKILWNFVKMLYEVSRHNHPLSAEDLQVALKKQQELLQGEAERFGLAPQQVEAIKALWDMATVDGSFMKNVIKYFIFSGASPYRDIAEKIRQILGVRYVVFGHTHDRDLNGLPDDLNRQGEFFNSGTWNMTFPDETERLLRSDGDRQFAFVRLVRGPDSASVELLEWKDDRGAPSRIKMLEHLKP